MNWIYENKEIKSIQDIPENAIGFVYVLIFNDNYFYIGKKNIFTLKMFPALKSGVLRHNATRIGRNIKGKRVFFDEVKKESNWKTYTGSKKDYGERVLVRKEILEFARSKRELTYLEVKYQFIHSVLEDPMSLNSNILNKFFRDNLV